MARLRSMTTLLGLSPSANAGSVRYCGELAAFSGVAADASTAIQNCIARTFQGDTLLLPPGNYRMDKMVVIKTGMTLSSFGARYDSRICGQSNLACANLIASPYLQDNAILYGDRYTSNYTIDHIVVDGNRANRLANAEAVCNAAGGRDAYLFNGHQARIQYSVFKNALCGTAFAFALDSTPAVGAVIYQNIFSDNGDHYSNGLWSDGLTIGSVDRSYVINNYFYNNSDVSLILGGGTNSSIVNNVFVQSWQGEFATLMLTNWTVFSPVAQMAWADFRGLTVSNNWFDVGNLSEIAVEIGVLPWAGQQTAYQGNLRTMGGLFVNNIFISSKQNINVAGGGTPGVPVRIGVNQYYPSGPQQSAGPTQIPTSLLNIQNPWEASFVSLEDPYRQPSQFNWDSF